MFPTSWNPDWSQEAMGYTDINAYKQFESFWSLIYKQEFNFEVQGSKLATLVTDRSKAMIFGMSDGGRMAWVANMQPTLFSSNNYNHPAFSKGVAAGSHAMGKMDDLLQPGVVDMRKLNIAAYWTYEPW